MEWRWHSQRGMNSSSARTVTVSQATGLAESFIDRFCGGGKAPGSVGALATRR